MLKVIGQHSDRKVQTVIDGIVSKIQIEKKDLAGEVYIGYPIFIDPYKNETFVDMLIITYKGVIVCNILRNSTIDYTQLQDDLYNKIESKLKKYPFLVDRRDLKFKINIITYSLENITPIEGFCVVSDIDNFYKEIDSRLTENFDLKLYDNVNTGFQESYGIRTREKSMDTTKEKANLITEMNEKIERYDCNQMEAILTDPKGIQRIRGMAGSGKTIVLARKAVEIHTAHPDWNVVVTFSTRSLKNQIVNLIEKFYTTKNDNNKPNYDKLKIMNTWGSKSSEGLYYSICSEHQIKPYTLSEAKIRFGSRNTFDKMCKELNSDVSEFHKMYDCIIVDEAQDFGKSFYEMCLNVLDENKRLVYAYDELQNLNETTMPTPRQLFGHNVKNDTPLKICYRNQSEIIVTAHAIGLGIYSKNGIVQIPNTQDVWESIGYKFDKNIEIGKPAILYRTEETSPNFLNAPRDELVKFIECTDKTNQYDQLMNLITDNILNDGLSYSNIMVIDMDAIACSNNRDVLALRVFDVKNRLLKFHLAGASSPEDFFREDSIVYTSFFRAKGNEAFFVYIVNAQSSVQTLSSVKMRNALFTAISRSKGWVRVLGYGTGMNELCKEFDKIKENDYKLNFDIYPTGEDIVKNNKDIDEKDEISLKKTKELIQSYINSNDKDKMSAIFKELFGVYSEGELEDVLTKLKESNDVDNQ